MTDLSSYRTDIDEEDDCDLNMISVADREINIYGRRLCLLCPDGMADLRDLRGGHRMITGWTIRVLLAGTRVSRIIGPYQGGYDCLCLMTLFRTVMYLARYWAVKIVCPVLSRVL